MKKRKKFGMQVSFEGNPWTYRRPMLIRGLWRCNRRHWITKKVEQIILEAQTFKEAVKEIDEKAAKEREAAKNAEKELIKPQEESLGRALDAWASTWDLREVTRKDYEGCIGQFKEALGENRQVSEVTLKELEDLFAERWKDLKGQTKLKYRALLVRAWKYFVNHGHVKLNLPERIEIPKKWRQEVRLARRTAGQGLTVQEAQDLLRAAREPYMVDFTPKAKRGEGDILTEYTPPPWLWWLCLIGLRTGLRSSNMITRSGKPGLLWRHVDLGAKVLQIEGAFMKNGMDFEVPLHDELARELLKLRKSLRRIPKPDEPIIRGTLGVNVQKAFKAACRRAGLGDRNLRVHDLRHVFASWIGSTCARAVEQRLLGHAAQTISDHYARHQEMETLRNGINSLPPLLGGRRPATMEKNDNAAQGR